MSSNSSTIPVIDAAKISKEHYFAPIPAIDPNAGKGADNDKGNPREKSEQCQRRGCAGLLIGPDEQCEPAHAGPQERHQLTAPDDGKGTKAGCGVVRQGCGGMGQVISCIHDSVTSY
ncbi:MAG: hypothetical protein R2867_40380 [Caldilineaceae bacterium]